MDGSGGGGAKCGRWIPTSEQVKVLTDLFRSGLRTPTADQIQKISLQLSFYGKIESKNVFYWFQNHKARERQVRRKIPTVDREKSDNSGQDNNSSAPTTRTDVKQMDVEKYGAAAAAMETEKVTETLQLFPLKSSLELEGSCSRDESKKLRLAGSECKETTPFSYTMETGVCGPPLDLRLSFYVKD